MPRPMVLLVTASEMPKPDIETELVRSNLMSLGIEATIMPWDAIVEPQSANLVVLRTPWDYFRRLPEFLVWAQHVNEMTTLANPLDVIVWNSHKSYLLDLARDGIPIVPTILLGLTERIDWSTVVARFGSGEIVAKPAVGIGAVGTKRGKLDDASMGNHVAALLSNGDVLLQPFVATVPRDGEMSLVYLGGRFSHAVRKRPAAGDFRVQDHHGGSVEPHDPSPEELDLAAAALASAPGELLYGRVDLVTHEGRLVVMELELIEPELFLGRSSGAAERFAAAIRDLTARSSFW